MKLIHRFRYGQQIICTQATSEDGGATWSVPSIINMRKESEQSFGWWDAVWLLQRIEFYLQHTRVYRPEIKIVWRFIPDDGVRRGKEVQSVSGWVQAVVTEANGKAVHVYSS